MTWLAKESTSEVFGNEEYVKQFSSIRSTGVFITGYFLPVVLSLPLKSK